MINPTHYETDYGATITFNMNICLVGAKTKYNLRVPITYSFLNIFSNKSFNFDCKCCDIINSPNITYVFQENILNIQLPLCNKTGLNTP